MGEIKAKGHPAKMDIQVKFTIDDQEVEDIVINAVELGAIDYWSSTIKYMPGKTFETRIIDPETGTRYTITQESIKLGLERILGGSVKVRADIVRSIFERDIDAEAQDCIIQAGLLGDVLYG